MKIYISHRRNSEFQKDLYEPLKQSELANVHTFIFPHDNNPQSFDAKDLLQNKKCDLILAEVSYPATGQGIELGWSNVFEIPIICIYKEGSDISGSLNFICKDFIEYQNSENMIEKLKQTLEKNA